MPQLYFEPVANKIGDDDWLVVPKNDADEIDVANYPSEASETTTNPNIKSGTYRFMCRCNTLTKDCIMAMWGNPVDVDGVLTGHAHSSEIIPALVEQYEDVWLPNDDDKYELEIGEETTEYDDLTSAITAYFTFVKQSIRIPRQPQESGGDDDDDS